MDNKSLGFYGEELAINYLKDKNYEIIAKNYKRKSGEIDIIALYENLIIFIEVKTRRTKKYGYAYEAVNKEKQNKIINTSMIYLKENNFFDYQPRYDIIEIYFMRTTELNHIENAFYNY